MTMRCPRRCRRWPSRAAVPEANPPQITFESLLPGRFVARDNRFRARVALTQGEVDAYLPNPGRLRELLLPGRQVMVRPVTKSAAARRRTAHDLVLVSTGAHWVCLDSRLPNALVAQLLDRGWLPGFEAYRRVRREVRLGTSIIDFRLEGQGTPYWLEAKSVTLVEEGTAAFPDAPTERGRRHLRELLAAVRHGERAGVLFVVQREDAERFAPHDSTDPEFGALLRTVAREGVEVRALRCRVTVEGVAPLEMLPVWLEERV